MLDEFEVAYVVARLVDVVGGPPRPGPLSDSDSDDDYDLSYGHDLVDREPDGECIGCGAVGVAGGAVSFVWGSGGALGQLVPLQLRLG
jgi:hypothetical protein